MLAGSLDEAAASTSVRSCLTLSLSLSPARCCCRCRCGSQTAAGGCAKRSDCCEGASGTPAAFLAKVCTPPALLPSGVQIKEEQPGEQGRSIEVRLQLAACARH